MAFSVSISQTAHTGALKYSVVLDQKTDHDAHDGKVAKQYGRGFVFVLLFLFVIIYKKIQVSDCFPTKILT